MGKTTAVLSLLATVVTLSGKLEPMREGPIHDEMRRVSTIVNPLNPGIEIIHPLDGEEFGGILEIIMHNWEYVPELALPGSRFAEGYREHQRGHNHVWIFDTLTGEQVRFLGAGGWIETPDGTHVRPLDLEPGMYKAYFQLQNHDHTPAIQSAAPSFPAMASTIFTVT